MKIGFMYLIVFLVFLISIYNLFYKPGVYHLFGINKKPSKFTEILNITSSDAKLFCSINGYKCETPSCNCQTICSGQYKKFHVYPDENVIMFNEKLSPGTYCLPKGFEHCNMQRTTPIYSVNGWVCISKNNAIWNNDRLVACQNSYSVDNSLNILIDRKTNQPLSNEIIKDYYELHNGKLRFQCTCNSLDKSGNRLIHLDEIPFRCFSDYCLEKLHFRRGIPGFNSVTKQCDCAHLQHENVNDLSSPCVEKAFQLQKNIFSGSINCMNINSLREHFIFCNKQNMSGILSFEKILNFSDNPIDYLNTVI